VRNVYGLLLLEIREEFGLPTEVLGFIVNGLYAGYLRRSSPWGCSRSRSKIWFPAAPPCVEMGGADITTKILGASATATPIWCHRAYTPGGPVWPVMIAGDILVYWKAGNLTSTFDTKYTCIITYYAKDDKARAAPELK
jgi:hypothetical protein